MGFTLITGPANSGKTRTAVERLGRFSPFELAKSARYVVPTQEAARQAESLLMEQLGMRGLLGNVACTFFSFAEEFIAREGLSSHLISDVKKELTLRRLVREVGPEYLGRSAESPGFIGALDRIIGELKISLVDPEALKAALTAERAGLTEASAAKLAELSALYERYQEKILLANNLHDREGLMWRALEIAAGGGLGGLEVVVFDGFDRMNAVERRFLEAAVEHVPEVIVTVGYEEGRPELFEPSEETRRFALALGAREISLKPSEGGPLGRLADRLFREEDEPAPAPALEGSDQAVTILEGCDPAMEVELAAEEILRLAAGGCDWGDILVTARDLRGYRDRVADIFAENGIPLAEPKRPLAETAVARLLLACVNIIRDDWPRDEVVRLLKSELIAADQRAACLVEIKAKERAVIRGKAEWLRPWGAGDKFFDFRRRALGPMLDFTSAVRAARALPAAEALPAMAEAARALLGTFTWRTHDKRALAEDAAAHARLLEVLTELEEARNLLGPLRAADFFNLLEEIIYLSEYAPLAPGANTVRLAAVTAVGGQKYQVVFVLGMLEKSFPRPPREEPFLRDKERAVLNRRLAGALELRLRPGPVEERALFYTAVASAAERLYLCYPLTNAAAKDSLASFFLNEVDRVLGAVPRRRRDHAALVPAPAAVFGRSRLDRAVVYALAHDPLPAGDAGTSPAATAARAYNELVRSDPARWIRTWRDSAERPALLADPRVLADLADPERRLRCTELEVYAACPFRHFCSYSLKLKGVPEEVGALDFGSLVHDVLYELFRELRAECGDDPALGRLDPAETIARAFRLLQERFEKETRLRNMPPYERDLLLHDLKTALGRYLKHEISAAVPGFAPALFELEFGGPGVQGRARDELSTEEPLVIEDGGHRVAVAGKIDRVDIGAAGGLVIDYKSGRTPNLANYEDGLNFQPLLYARALRDVFGIEPVGAEYRPIKRWRPDGLYAQVGGVTGRLGGRTLDDDRFQEALRACAAIVIELAGRLRAGRIEIEPLECAAYCEFSGVCRREEGANGL